MNSYLVYLLLHGKVRSKELADERYLGKKGYPIWCIYPKWWYHNKIYHYYERNDLWEYEIYKDIKGEFVVKRIFDAVVQAISVHADFYLHYDDHTYIRVYGFEEQPLLIPKYASNRLILMEFARQLLFLKERVWRKDATINLPISISNYVLQTWVEASNMKKELQQYVFYKEVAARNYDPRGVIAHFYSTAFQKPIAFKCKSLGNVEKYKNVLDEGKIGKIDALINNNKAPLQVEKAPQQPKTTRERSKASPLRIKSPPPINRTSPS